MEYISTASADNGLRAWHCATTGGELLPSARQLADHWLHKGGDIFRRAERFIWLETLRMAGLTLSAALCGQSSFTVQVCQLRLLAVFQCLGGEDLRAEATQRQALAALHGTPERHDAGWQLLTLPGVLCHTWRTGRRFHRRYVVPNYPKLKSLR